MSVSTNMLLGLITTCWYCVSVCNKIVSSDKHSPANSKYEDYDRKMAYPESDHSVGFRTFAIKHTFFSLRGERLFIITEIVCSR